MEHLISGLLKAPDSRCGVESIFALQSYLSGLRWSHTNLDRNLDSDFWRSVEGFRQRYAGNDARGPFLSFMLVHSDGPSDAYRKCLVDMRDGEKAERGTQKQRIFDGPITLARVVDLIASRPRMYVATDPSSLFAMLSGIVDGSEGTGRYQELAAEMASFETWYAEQCGFRAKNWLHQLWADSGDPTSFDALHSFRHSSRKDVAERGADGPAPTSFPPATNSPTNAPCTINSGSCNDRATKTDTRRDRVRCGSHGVLRGVGLDRGRDLPLRGANCRQLDDPGDRGWPLGSDVE